MTKVTSKPSSIYTFLCETVYEQIRLNIELRLVMI